MEGKVSIVTVVWDHLELTKRLLEGVFKYTKEPYELIVVDNGSRQDTLEYLESLKAQKPDIVIIRNEQNEGFSKGFNKGILASTGDYIIAISNDVDITDSMWVEMLVMPHKTRKCITGPQYIPYNQLTVVGGYIVDYLGGWLLCFKKGFFEEVGYWDEDFTPAYFEDVELCFRAKYIYKYELLEVKNGCMHNHPSSTANDGRLTLHGIALANQMKYREKIAAALRQYNITLNTGFSSPSQGNLKGDGGVDFVPSTR